MDAATSGNKVKVTERLRLDRGYIVHLTMKKICWDLEEYEKKNNFIHY